VFSYRLVNDQASADVVRFKLRDLSQKINTTVQPVFGSQKIEQNLKLREAKPPIVNQQCLAYKFECDLCDAGFVGFNRRHLHLRIEEHKNSLVFVNWQAFSQQTFFGSKELTYLQDYSQLQGYSLTQFF